MSDPKPVQFPLAVIKLPHQVRTHYSNAQLMQLVGVRFTGSYIEVETSSTKMDIWKWVPGSNDMYRWKLQETETDPNE